MAKILCIGIGRMGLPMAVNLLKAGHEVAVLDKNPSRVEAAVKQGARAAADMGDGVRGADFIVTSLLTPDALVEVVAGPDGAAAHMEPGQTLIEMSTVSVSASRKCAEAIAPTGGQYLRCPVNGSTVFAEAGKLTIIASGPKQAYERALPLLEKLSQTRFYIGEAEQARLMKLAVNVIIAATQAIFTEAAVLCEKGDIDWNTALDVFAGSSIASPQLLFKIPPLRKRDYTPAGTTGIVIKDTVMALEAAREMGVYMPVTAITAQIFEAAAARGHGDKDFSVILETVEAMSGVAPSEK